MFARLIRVFKSWVGYVISFAEDPEVMLQQAAEEMRNTLPRLNQVLISTRATAIKLSDEERRLLSQERELASSIQAALREGTDNARTLAEDDAATLQQVREDMGTTREQLETASRAHENALVMIDEMKKRLRERIMQAQRAVEEHRRAKVMGSAAAALSQLEAYDTGATTEKYFDQIRQKSAEARAAMEISMGSSGDLTRIKTERDIRKARARGLLREFEVEMEGEERKPAEITAPENPES